MAENKIIEFLIKAKQATYAGKGPEMLPSRPNSHDLQYVEDNLKYIDSYLGSEKFAGEEAMWDEDKPFWSMNYCGRVLGTGFDGDFLKEALLNTTIDMPYRGPLEYKKGNMIYKCVVNGNFEWFEGREEIYFENTKIYECNFHGGSIK